MGHLESEYWGRGGRSGAGKAMPERKPQTNQSVVIQKTSPTSIAK